MSDCPHTRITTWNFDDGKPAGFWSCADCGRKFAPLNVKIEEAARMALAALGRWDALIQHQYTGSRAAMTDMHYAAQHTLPVMDALREALGDGSA